MLFLLRQLVFVIILAASVPVSAEDRCIDPIENDPMADHPYLGPTQGVAVALIHGFFDAGWGRPWLRWMQAIQIPNVHLFHDTDPTAFIADYLIQKSVLNHNAIVIIGHSQGGFRAIKVARHLRDHGFEIAFLATMATGGLGRMLSRNWLMHDIREMPINTRTVFNFFTARDLLGTDADYLSNFAFGDGHRTYVINQYLPEAVGHLGYRDCFNLSTMARKHMSLIWKKVCEPILNEISRIR